MMLLNIYIKPSFIGFILLLLLSACSSTPEEKESNASQVSEQEQLKNTSQDIIDLVDVSRSPVSPKSTQSDVNAKLVSPHDLSLLVNKENLYLKNQKNMLATLPKPVIKKFEQALALMRQKQWQKAGALFDEVIIAEPMLSGSYVNKAIISMKQKQAKEAMRWIDKAILVNSKNPYAYRLKGLLARLEGDFIQAEKNYLNALAIWPGYAQVHLDMAVLLELYRGKLLQSRHYYQTYLALNKKDEQANKWLAGLNIKIIRAGLDEKPIVSNNKVIENKTVTESAMAHGETN